MIIVLTSFRDAKNWKGTKCSIARWQPTWSDMPEFPINIKPILDGKILGDWMGPVGFRNKYEQVLKNKELELIKFFSYVEDYEPLVFCCWCTLDRQLTDELLCHRILFGWWIEDHFNYFKVIYADGAEKPIWKR